jgi:hypothetical protein
MENRVAAWGKEAERKRERWHGTQREKAAGLMPCPDGEKRTRWSFFMSTDKEKGGGMMLCVFFFFFRNDAMCGVVPANVSVYTQ